MSHGFGFNLLAVLTQLHEKWPDSFSAAAFTYPENLMGIRIGHHCGVTMAFEQGKNTAVRAKNTAVRAKNTADG